MATRGYAIGDKVLVRHFKGGPLQATIIEVGDSKPFWGTQYLVHSRAGDFHAYANEFIEPGDYDFVF